MKLTTAEVAEHLRVDPRTVLNMIRDGRLKAIDVRPDPRKGKPVYRIDESEVADFERRREIGQPAAKQPQRKRSRMAGVTKFF